LKPVREQVNTFRLNSLSGQLTELQLTRAFNDLSWSSFLTSKSSNLQSLLKQLSTNGKTPVFHLCYLSILLGKGSLNTKAEVFFHLVDSEAKGQLNEKQLFNSLKTLFELSTINLPKLAVHSRQLTENEYESFLLKFQGKLTSVLFSICDEILKKKLEIDLSDFLKSCKNLKLFPYFFEPQAIRFCLINAQMTESEENYLKNSESADSSKGFVDGLEGNFQGSGCENDLKAIVENDSPTLDYTSSDSSLDEILEKPKKVNKKKPFVELKALKPPRPGKHFKLSEPNSPCVKSQEEGKGSGRERWKNNGETKTIKKVRCSSAGRNNTQVVLNYQVNGKIVEIELAENEDPIKVAHNFSVKNQLSKRERNNIALMLTRLQKSKC
jgi:hypothetical protein